MWNIFKRKSNRKFKREGSCKRCGNCCRSITFKIGDDYITNEEQFGSLRRWQPRYNHFFVSGRDEDGALLFTCESLGEDNLCKSYHFRSLYCRSYPQLEQDQDGLQTFGCGYSFLIPE